MKTQLSEHVTGVTSTASIAGHPLHPAVVPFPIAFLVGTLLADIASGQTADPFWARASVWLLGAGVATGLLAAVLGAIDFITIKRARSTAAGWVHFVGNGLALALSGFNLAMRLGNPERAVSPGQMALSAVVAVLLLITGWFGGELAYRYRIGVVEERRE